MKSTIFLKKSTPKDAYDTLLPITKLLNHLALAKVTRKKGQLIISESLSKNLVIIIFTLMAIIIFILKVTNYLNVNWKFFFRFTDTIQITYLLAFAHYIVDVIYVRKYGKECFINYLKLYDRFDHKLGNLYHSILKEKVMKMVINFCVFGAIVCITDFVALGIVYGWIVPTLYAVDYVFYTLNMLILIEMSSNILQVEYRLKTMGDLMQEFYVEANNKVGVFEDIISDKNWLYFSNDFEERRRCMRSLKIEEVDYEAKISSFKRCYLLLIEQNNYINTTFGIRILINVFNILFSMVNMTNLAIRILFGILPSNEYWYLCITTSIIRLVYFKSVLSWLVHRSEQCYVQSGRILSIIDHTLVDKKITTEMKSTLSEFRNLVLTRPVQFHATNFFQLRYSLLVSITSVVVTYTIILLQSMK